MSIANSQVRRLLAAVAFVAALIAAWLSFRGFSSDPRPAAVREIPRAERSVLLLTIDTTRADYLQPYGAENVRTPTFQRLADTGILFERAYAVAPITLVSHTSILTGMVPPAHGVRNNGIHYVDDALVTLAERFSEAGYATGAFVSAAVLDSRYNLGQGFDVYDDDLSTGRERHPRMVPDRPAEATVDSTMAWLDQLDADEEFFAWAHFYDPHAAYSPPPPFRDEYRGNLYAGEIAYLDSQIDRLLQHPRLRSGDVAVVLVADHGESLGEHGEQTHAILAYDSTLHIPMIMKLPGGPEGLRVRQTVGHADIAPTLLDLVGLRVHDGMNGRSLLQMLERPMEFGVRGVYSETYLPYYTYGWAQLRAWRQGTLKYIDAPSPELYDTARDPRELSNRADQMENQAHDLQRNLDEFLESVGGAEQEARIDLDSDSAERLRALGYLAVGSGPVDVEGERPDPKDVIALHTGLERARRLMNDELYEGAERELRTVLREDPNNLAAMMDMARALSGLERTQEAIEIVERAISLDPEYASMQLLLSRLEAQRGNIEQALAVAQVATDLDPSLPEGLAQEARLLAQLGRQPEAAEVLSVGLESQPDSPVLNTSYTQLVELREGLLEAARGRLQRVVEIDPFYVAAWRLLGLVQERLGDREEAKKAFYAGLRREPDNADLHRRLGLMLAEEGAGGETEAHLREALRLSDGLGADLRVALGGWLAEHGRVSEAMKEYEVVLAALPDHRGALNNRAISMLHLGRVEEAKSELLTLAEQHEEFADPFNNLAAIAIQEGNWAAVERYARRALARQPEMVPAWNNLGVGLDEQNDLAEAEKAFRRALELDTTYWQARLNLAIVLRKRDQSEDAEQQLKQVLSQVPTLPDVHLELGRLYADDLARPKEARVHYNAFLRAVPQHPLAGQVRNAVANLPADVSR